MREILLKAKRLDNGEWVEGSLLQTTAVSLKYFIVQSACYTFGKLDWIEITEVDSDTICQYTGLTDKNGKKIWENDICDRKEPFPEIVKMQKGDWILDYSYAVGRENCYCNLGFYVCERNSVEVIGNIFDNAELLDASCTNSRTGN